MKIFIVTDGTYSDYHIVAVFSTKEKAEAYCALHGYDFVEEYEIDAVKVNGDVKVFHNYVFTRFLGALELIEVKLTTKNRAKIKKDSRNFEIEIPLKEENKSQAYKIARALYEHYKFKQEDMDLEFMIEE